MVRLAKQHCWQTTQTQKGGQPNKGPLVTKCAGVSASLPARFCMQWNEKVTNISINVPNTQPEQRETESVFQTFNNKKGEYVENYMY